MAYATILIRSLALLLVAVAASVGANAAAVPDRTMVGTRAVEAAGHCGWHGATGAVGTFRACAATRRRIAQARTGARIGGGCVYRDVPGTVTIVRVAKTAASSGQASSNGGPGYEGFEISFSFAADQPIAAPAVRDFARRPHVLRLVNSWYPGPRYIEKYHLEPGRKFSAVLKVLASGACTPMLFFIAGVDRADYFERAH